MSIRHTTVRSAALFGSVSTLCLCVVLAMPSASRAQSDASHPLVRQAKAGHFEKVLKQLDQGLQGDRPPRVQSLIGDLKRFQRNKAQRLEAQQKAYDEAQQDIKTNLEEDDLESAMIAAIQARQVAPQRWEALSEADPNTRQAVQRIEQAARQAMEKEQWIEALSDYRLLDTLFDQKGKYREPLKRVRRHVRVLRLYAPEVLQDMQEAYADRQGEDDDEADDQAQDEADSPVAEDPVQDIEFTRWQKRLRGVRPTMLRQAVRYAEQRHVSGTSFVALMKGAVHGLEVLIETDQLAKTFPAFKDKQPVNRFDQHLDDLQKRLHRDNAELNYHQATSMIDGILAVNRQTLKLPTRVVVYELTDGATSELDDFSSVIWPEDLSQFNRSIEGNFTGVGIQITRRDGELMVVTPLPNTPAYNAGIRAGDMISEVDGEDASRWSLNRAVREITGPEGSVVTLGIERTGKKKLLKFDLERAEIEIESVRGWQQTKQEGWDYWIDENSGVGYIRVSQFIKQTAGDLDKAVGEMQNQRPINGLILDLRYNPGGLLRSAQDVADRFIDDGPIVSTVDAQGNRNTQHRASGQGTYGDFPVVVLINDASASASEIVSGALQAYDRALVVGNRSFGKGSVQDLFPLVRRQAYLKLTTQYYTLPGGRIIHRKPGDETWGIEPDLTIAMTNEQRTDAIEMRQEADVLRQQADAKPAETQPIEASKLLEDGVDPQLEAALLYLKTRLVAADVAVAQLPGQKAKK
jgi:carboxyl-terminal processing protease